MLTPSSNHFYNWNKCFLLFGCGLAAVLSIIIPISIHTVEYIFDSSNVS